MVLENYDYRNSDGEITSSGELTARRESTEDERAAAKAAIGITDVTEGNPEFNYNPMLDNGRVIVDPNTGLPMADPGAYTNQEGYSIDPITGLENTDDRAKNEKKKTIKPGTPYDEWLIAQSKNSAKAILTGLLAQFGLQDLGNWANEQIMLGKDANAVVMEMRYGTDPTVRAAYDTRFPGMALRRAAGMSEISESAYIETVRGYNQIAKTAGLNADFLGTGDSVTQLIAGDISLSEWRSRVQVAEEAARIADPEVLNMLATRYNYDQKDMVALFLDPEKTKSYMANKRVLGASKIAGASATLIGREQSFSQELSEYLNDMGVQKREAAARLAPVAGLAQSVLGEQQMSGTLIGESLFGLTANKDVDRRKQSRNASFQGRGGLMGASQGITGLGGSNT
jgi:hypothetical protein